MTVSKLESSPNPLAKFLPNHEELSVVTAADGFTEITTDRSRVIEVLRALRDRPEFDCNLLLDVCGVDYPENEQRFEVVYHLTSLEKGHRIRVRVAVDEEDPRVPTAYGIWKAADWFEREAFDMFGIRFDGHPDLRRLLTDYGFSGHPLRKDFPLTGHVELRYDDDVKRCVYEPVNLTQEFRNFDFLSPWEGPEYETPAAKEGEASE